MSVVPSISITNNFRGHFRGSKYSSSVNLATNEAINKNVILKEPFKWRILSQPGKIGSGKNIFFLIFPTELQVHLEDMF